MLFSNIIFAVIVKLFGKKVVNKIDEEVKDEYENYNEKEINPNHLLISDLVNSVIYAPITEELFFRFFLFKTVLYKKFKFNVHVANLLQAFTFGGFHITNSVFGDQQEVTTLIQIISASISGVINGYAYYYFNSIVPCVVAHLLNNMMATHYNYKQYISYVEEKKSK
jgi:membrane protease YdiL (CAAX protease family)